MASIDTSKEYHGSYKLYDRLSSNSKTELVKMADHLGLHVPTMLKKNEFSDFLEKEILSNPEVWMVRLSRYELQLMQLLVKAGKDGSVSETMLQIRLPAITMGFLNDERDEADHTVWHYTMPNELRKAVEPHIDSVLADSTNRQLFQIQQYALGILMLYGVLPASKFDSMVTRYILMLPYDEDTCQKLRDMFFNTLLVNESYYKLKDEINDFHSVFVSPAIVDVSYTVKTFKVRKDVDYKFFTEEEFLLAGSVPMHKFPCKAYQRSLDFLVPYYENENDCRQILLDIWMMDQHGVNLQNLIFNFLPYNLPDSKRDEGMRLATVFLNSIPRWILKGHSLDEVNRTVTSGNQPFKAEKKVGRNDPCPCGSGKKYKHCCGK